MDYQTEDYDFSDITNGDKEMFTEYMTALSVRDYAPALCIAPNIVHDVDGDVSDIVEIGRAVRRFMRRYHKGVTLKIIGHYIMFWDDFERVTMSAELFKDISTEIPQLLPCTVDRFIFPPEVTEIRTINYRDFRDNADDTRISLRPFEYPAHSRPCRPEYVAMYGHLCDVLKKEKFPDPWICEMADILRGLPLPIELIGIIWELAFTTD